MGSDSHRRSHASCPRCGRPVREPTAWSSAWRCELHGEVHPLLPPFSPSREGLDGLLRFSGVPVLAPGELITAEALEALREVTADGGRIAYAADPTLATFQVVTA